MTGENTDGAPVNVPADVSVFSEEEQKEILADIDAITEKNKRALAEEKPLSSPVKKGLLFPLLVNAGALALLAAGILVLSSVYGKDESRIRQGEALYTTAERALIQKIRQETASLLEEKNREIDEVISKLANLDADLQDLQYSSELDAQRRREALLKLQDEYRVNLGALQSDRSRILETSRVREETLKSELAARTAEFNALSEQSGQALDAARIELARLTDDRERAALIDSQLLVLYGSARDRINKGQLKEAAETLAAVRTYLNTPAFQNNNLFNNRRTLYEISLVSLEEAVAAAGETKNLARDNAAEYEARITELRNQNAAQARQAGGFAELISEKDAAIANMKVQSEGLNGTIQNLEDVNQILQGQNENLSKENEDLKQQFERVRQAVGQ